jgi:capsular polysaccharide biosynthesis protein
VTLRDYVLIVARNWIVVAASVAVGLVMAAVVAFTTPTTYSSTAQVLFTGHASTSGQDLAYVGTYVQSRMQTYENLGTSTSVLESVADVLNSDETPQELADRTDIQVSQLDTVASVSATDTTAKGAADTANTLGGALLEAVRKLEADNAADPNAEGDGQPATATIQGVVTGKAEVPTSPSAPQTPLYLIAGLLAGIVVSIGVIAVREVLRGDTSTPPGEEP